MENNFGNSAFDNFEILEDIGTGAYGIVYKAFSKGTNEEVAIKEIKVELENEGIPSSALREISLLKDISHKRVLE